MTQYVMIDPRINGELLNILIINNSEALIFKEYAEVYVYLADNMQENDTFQEISPASSGKVFYFQDFAERFDEFKKARKKLNLPTKNKNLWGLWRAIVGAFRWNAL